ncbi:hypothetical protein [Asanoa sp. NPDC050611]|uniref:hypothetical protein n=1 Tax=Asanoa sp. NPDC050611 TaxID=3157098 RepID=UPI0033D06C79
MSGTCARSYWPRSPYACAGAWAWPGDRVLLTRRIENAAAALRFLDDIEAGP